MKVKYIGDDNKPPVETVVFGHRFELGKEVEIEDEKVLAKLKGNKTFEIVEDKKPKAKADK